MEWYIMVIGITSLVLTDSIVGLLQYTLTRGGVNPDLIREYVHPFIILHSISCLLLALGIVLFLIQVITTLKSGKILENFSPEFHELRYRGRDINSVL